jgi:predicted nucleotidyltransferase component of viral defense system
MPKNKPVRDMGASVRARLLKIAQERGNTFDLILTRYALERFLYRLSISPHKDRFVLKGAMLVTTWFDDPHRPTRDIDLLGFGDPSQDGMLSIFREVCCTKCDDGMIFDAAALRVDVIREELKYGGLRLRTEATLASARIAIVVDIGFGDSTEPGDEKIDLPVLLDLPAPKLRAYARETVIAEKFHAMVALGRANSRMKDFYDVWLLSKSSQFTDDRLPRAIAATFKRRETLIPDSLPDALTLGFAKDENKRRQWAAFVRDLAKDAPPLEVVISEIAAFLQPMSLAAKRIGDA